LSDHHPTALVGPNNGKAKVTIDGTVVGTPDLYDTSFHFATFTFGGGLADLPGVTHTLKITVQGKKRAAATDTIVTLDQLHIICGPPSC